MTRFEKIEKECIKDLNLLVRKHLNDNWHVDIALNYLALRHDIGSIRVHLYDESTKIEIKTQEKDFEIHNASFLEFNYGINKFLTDVKFQDKLFERLNTFIFYGSQMINDKTYTQEVR